MTQGYSNGVPIDTDVTLAADSDLLVASQKATKTYVDNSHSTIITANEASDTTCFPIFVTQATGTIGAKTNTGLTYNSSTNVLGARLLASAGSATAGTAPLKFTPSSLMTTPEVGAVELKNDNSTDSFALRATNNATFGREIIRSYNEFYSGSGQSGLSGSNKPVWKNGGSSPYNGNNDIPIYQKSSNTLHEIEMWIIYNVSQACTATFTFTSGVSPAPSGWFTRVEHSRLSGATSGNSGTINQSTLICDLQANSNSTTQTFTVSPSGAGDFIAHFTMFFTSNGTGTGSLATTLGTDAGTFTINANSNWKCRIVPNNGGNVIA